MKKFLLVLGFFISLVAPTYSQGVVCRNQYISGFHEEHDIGASVCGPLTQSIADTKIYIMVKGDQIYAQSNFLNAGADYPTKLATSDYMDSFETLAMNLFFTQQPTEYEFNQMVSVLKRDIDVIIDPSFFNSSKFSRMDLDGIHHMKIYGPDKQVYDAVKLIESDGKIQYCLHYNKQFSIRLKSQNLGFILSSLDKEAIDFDKLKIVNLLLNTATEEKLVNEFSSNRLQFDFSSKEAFKHALLSNGEGQTILLGHIEEGDFVTLNSGNEEIFRIPISEIEEFRKENHLAIILAGCSSAKAGAGSGVVGAFRSIEFLDYLTAMRHAKDNKELLEGLGEGKLHIVVGDSFFNMNSDELNNVSDAIVVDIRKAGGSGGDGESGGVYVGPSVGTLVFLGVGEEQINTSALSVAADSALQQFTDNSNSDGSDSDGGNLTKEKVNQVSGGNNSIWWILGGILVLVLMILRKSNKSV